jgi:hypothetical protein
VDVLLGAIGAELIANILKGLLGAAGDGMDSKRSGVFTGVYMGRNG